MERGRRKKIKKNNKKNVKVYRDEENSEGMSPQH